jgi:hypothetical protein
MTPDREAHMSAPVRGHVTSVKTIEGRTDIVIVAVRTGTDTGSGAFNCVAAAVTLNGKAAAWPWEIDRFVTTHSPVTADVVGPDWSQSGTGYTPCSGIHLTALE